MPRNQRGRGSSRRRSRLVNYLSHQLHGRRMLPPSMPRNVVTAHWNQATVVHIASGDVTLTINDIANELRDQYGLFATDTTNRIPIAIRLMAVQFWNLNIAIVGNSQLILNNLINWTEMIRLTCLPADNQWARTGYVYPASQNFVQHNHNDTNYPFKIDVRTDKWVLHISCLWRSLNGESYGQSTQRQLQELEYQLVD